VDHNAWFADGEFQSWAGSWQPSQDTGQAFEVVEAMRERVEGFVFDATTGVLGLWEASFLQVLSSKELEGAMDEKLISSEVGGSLPRASWIAALRATDA